MPMQLFQVDAFTGEMFKGNPAAVCLLAQPMPDSWMMSLAQEMNLSETAFLLPLADGSWSLRWFTPAVEVSLCGHATLASAHVLFENRLVDPDQPVCFATRRGELLARRTPGGIELDFPAQPPQPLAEPPQALLDALGVRPLAVLAAGNKHLVEIASDSELRALQPDFAVLAGLPGRGVAVTARADAGSGFDFVSRYFAPWVGINEDPVTGSAHTMLGPYWAQQLGKQELRAYQASARGGVLGVRVTPQRVYLTGQAVMVFRGELLA
ncbi:MAG: PhzF family phenazine biosynthesis protein [Anaerolineae bacterium]|nr:PhzF family phenazine biosynthesis protein [Anaerolineae bacterium]